MATYLDRYLAGERVEVWNELIALGDAVRRKPVQVAATRVADEIMRRARQNIETLIARLSSMGYRFAAPAIERELAQVDKQISEPPVNSYGYRRIQEAVAEGKMPASALDLKDNPAYQAMVAQLRKQKIPLMAELERTATMPPIENPRVYYEPEPGTEKHFKTIEKVTKGPLPLSLRSWYRQVGYVSFVGSHPVLNPDGVATADPLLVRPVAEILMGVPIVSLVAENMEDLDRARRNGKTAFTLSTNDLSKAGLDGGMPYRFWLPEASADVELRNLWRQTTFVGYLRHAFEWGGFPGWERDPSPPRDLIGELTQGLLPI